MTEKMQFAVAYASIIFLRKKSNAVSSLHRLCIASKSCYRCYIATKKLKKYEKTPQQTTTLKLLMAKPRYAFCNCAADQRLCFRFTDCTIPLIHKSKMSSPVQLGLCRIWSETPKTGFLTTRLKYRLYFYSMI